MSLIGPPLQTWALPKVGRLVLAAHVIGTAVDDPRRHRHEGRKGRGLARLNERTARPRRERLFAKALGERAASL
jgi:hypothetical protein